MRRRVGIGGALAAAACVAALLAPAGAGAQQGNGLYDPFPDPTTSRTAEGYYAELGVHVTAAQLDAGRALPGAAVPVPGVPAAAAAVPGPSARAGVGTRFPGTWAVAVLAGAALLVAGAAVLIAARR